MSNRLVEIRFEATIRLSERDIAIATSAAQAVQNEIGPAGAVVTDIIEDTYVDG